MIKTIKHCAFVLITIFLVAGCSSGSNTISYQSITIDEMYEVIDNGIIIDVRTYDEYIEYSLDESINIAYDEIDKITDIVDDLDTQIFVYCASGARSNVAAETLVSLGYTNVYDMGGIFS